MITFTDSEKEKILHKCLNQKTSDLFEFKQGDDLIVVGSRDTPYSQFEIVKAVNDVEEGIFQSRPFITVSNTNGDRFSCHASRLIKLEVINHD